MKTLTTLILAACCGSAFAQTVESVPLVKDPPKETKQALLVTAFPPSVSACPEGFDLYVQRVKPAGSKDPDTAFKGFFYIAPPDPHQPNSGMVTSRPGSEVVGACLKVK